jgi:hypothetical protein
MSARSLLALGQDEAGEYQVAKLLRPAMHRCLLRLQQTANSWQRRASWAWFIQEAGKLLAPQPLAYVIGISFEPPNHAFQFRR